MSFIIRTVAARAGGGDIVRSRTLDADTASIGRGTDCEIHLPDLAVYLRHATVTVIPPGTVAVQGVRDARFEAGGRIVGRATLVLANGPALIFGSYQLSFAAGSGPDEVVVTVSRMAGAGTTAEHGRLRHIFSLGPTLFSKRRAAWLFGLAILAGCLVAPIGIFVLGWGAAKIHPDRQWSTGPLSAGHAFLRHNCQACHQQAFVSVRDSACLACHQPADDLRSRMEVAGFVRAAGSPFRPFPAPDHAAPARLLRARPAPGDALRKISSAFSEFFGHPTDRCADCHTEHIGAAGQRVKRGTPERVARAQLRNFDCISCHGAIRERLSDSLVSDAPDWTRHPQFRPVIFVSPQGRQARAALAEIAREYSGLKFSHWQHLYDPAIIDEAVKLGPGRYGAPLTCRNCHVLAADKRSFTAVDMPRDCSSCHDLRFAVADNGDAKVLMHGNPDAVEKQLRAALAQSGQTKLMMTRRRPGYVGDPGRDIISGERRLSPQQVEEGVRGAFQKGGLCYGCHAFTQPDGPRSLVYRVVPIEFANWYLPWSAFDHGVPAHRQDALGRATCTNCHRVLGSNASSSMTLPPVSECRTCHGAPPARTRAAASADCMDCHGYHVADRPLSASFDALHRRLNL